MFFVFGALLFGADGKIMIGEMEKIIKDYAENPGVPRYDFLVDIYKLHRFYRGVLEVGEINALSLYSSLFLYKRSDPGVYRSDVDYLLDNLRENAAMDFETVAPRDVDEVLRFAVENVKEGNPILLISDKSEIVYGIEGNTLLGESGSRLGPDRLEEMLSNGDLHLLKMKVPGPIDEATRKEIFSRDIALRVLRKIVGNFERNSISLNDRSVVCGKRAYEAFIADLKNPAVSWADGPSYRWLGPSLEPQWTSLQGTIVYLTELYDQVKGDEKKILEKAILRFESAMGNWRFWDEVVNISWGDSLKVSQDVRDFSANMERRKKGASCVHTVLLRYEEGIEQLKKFLEKVEN